MAEDKFVTLQDFDIKKLRLCEGVINARIKYQTMKIEYEYPNGETSGLRLRSHALTSYGLKAYDDKPPKEYFMTSLCFHDQENPTEKEAKFKEILESICEFLREEAPRKQVKKKKQITFENLGMLKDNDVFYPKLKHDRNYDETGKITKSTIKTNFYEKKSKEGNLEKVKNPLSREKKPCRVVAYIDITSIFISTSILKVRTEISDLAIIKKDVWPIRRKVEKPPLNPSDVMLGSDDESDTEDEEVEEE